MKCPKCRHFNDVAAKFSAEYAFPLARTCAARSEAAASALVVMGPELERTNISEMLTSA